MTRTPQPPTNLQACLNTPAATCTLDRNLTLDTTLTISASGVTLVCSNGATIKTSTSNLGRALTINNAIAVRVQGCSFSRELNTLKGVIGDVILIVNSEDITLDHVTICCGVDETVDARNSTDVDILYSMIVYPQNDSTHTKGAHGYAMLIADNSEVLLDHVLFCCSKARVPQVQNSHAVIRDSIYFNWDGGAVQVVCDSTLTFQGNIGLTGLDTDAINYLIVAPNVDECLGALPRICENGNRLFGDRVYRMRRPSDKDYYVTCAVAELPAESEYWVRLNMVGAPLSKLTALIRESIVEGTGRIINVPIG